MSFNEISALEGDALTNAIDFMEHIVKNRGKITRLRAVVDDGTFKLKINEGPWTPPMGKLDPSCR